MLKNFSNVPGLSDLCEMLKRDEDNENHLKELIGKQKCNKLPVLDLLVETGMVESKSRFRKNPQIVFINAEKVSPETTIEESGFVLSIGKNSSFKCKFIEYEKEI